MKQFWFWFEVVVGIISIILGIISLCQGFGGLSTIFLGICFLVMAGYIKLIDINSKFSYIKGYKRAVTKTMSLFEEFTKDTLTTKDKCKFEELCFIEYDNDLRDSLNKLYEN